MLFSDVNFSNTNALPIKVSFPWHIKIHLAKSFGFTKLGFNEKR